MSRKLLLIATFLLELTAPQVRAEKPQVVESRLAQLTHSNFQLPYALVTDAGQTAAPFGSAERRWQFVMSYARGAKEALTFGKDFREEHADSIEQCASSAQQVRPSGCGYARGFEAITKKAIAVTLSDFGYLLMSVHGEVEETSQEGKYLQVWHERPWFLADSPRLKSLEPGKCYQLTGYLSNDGGFGGRFLPFSNEFIVMESKPAERPCIDPVRLGGPRR